VAQQLGWEGEVRHGRVTVPPYLLLGRDELQLRFDLRPLARGDCVAVAGDIRAAVEPDSTIDLSRAYRYARLPNLGFFGSSGFPFTRMADLSGTAAVLPERPNPVEAGAFLDLIGQLSAITGVPATGLLVVGPNGLPGSAAAQRDLLVLGTLARQPALGTLLQNAAVRVEGDRLTLALPDAVQEVRALLLDGPPRAERDRAGVALAEAGDSLAAILAAESPLSPGRSVVAFTGVTPAAIGQLVAGLRDPEIGPRIQGDVSLLAGGRIAAFRTGPTYGVGELPWWLWPQLWLGNRPELATPLLLLGAVLIGFPCYWILRRRAAIRLRSRTQA
jgi:cellulose synthase (UDP-forming)